MIKWGISAGFHDAALTVLENNNILFASHSERFSKIKNDPTLNDDLICYALTKYGAPDQVAYYENVYPKKFRQFIYGDKRWKQHPLNDVKRQLSDWGINKPITTFNHHLSHAAAGFQTSPFERAMVVIIDAVGESETITIWSAEYIGGQAKYTKLWSQAYPHSIGLFYSAFTQHAGLKPMEDEYIFMGMAAHDPSTGMPPTILQQIKSLYIADEVNCKFNENLHAGIPKEHLKYFKDVEQYSIAGAVQTITEELILSVLVRAHQFGWSENLVYGGGVALNCVANRLIGNLFKNCWIMPNPGDAGSSLGAAALIDKERLLWKDPFLGYEIGGQYPTNELLTGLMRKQIVGVASGKAEFGPRALGNRSLFADPRDPLIREKLNLIKQRQMFRPFGAAILEEFTYDYFHNSGDFMLDKADIWKSCPYMQSVFQAKTHTFNLYPGILHVDESCRLQTVPKTSTHPLRNLLEKWLVMTGCPILINTSLNIKGQPIVNDRKDAEKFQERYGITVYS